MIYYVTHNKGNCFNFTNNFGKVLVKIGSFIDLEQTFDIVNQELLHFDYCTKKVRLDQKDKILKQKFYKHHYVYKI